MMVEIERSCRLTGEQKSRLELAARGDFERFNEQVEALRLTVEALGPEVPVIQTVFSPITVAGYLVGKDKRRAVRDLLARPPTTIRRASAPDGAA